MRTVGDHGVHVAHVYCVFGSACARVHTDTSLQFGCVHVYVATYAGLPKYIRAWLRVYMIACMI